MKEETCHCKYIVFNVPSVLPLGGVGDIVGNIAGGSREDGVHE